MTDNKNLWVIVETKEDGSAVNVGLELMNPGRKMADAIDEKSKLFIQTQSILKNQLKVLT